MEEKKAKEELEKEKSCANALALNINRLKKILLEKEVAITTAGKLIEDLWVKKMEVARSFQRVKKANTDLVGENTSLYEHIRGEYLYLDLSFWSICPL